MVSHSVCIAFKCQGQYKDGLKSILLTLAYSFFQDSAESVFDCKSSLLSTQFPARVVRSAFCSFIWHIISCQTQLAVCSKACLFASGIAWQIAPLMALNLAQLIAVCCAYNNPSCQACKKESLMASCFFEVQLLARSCLALLIAMLSTTLLAWLVTSILYQHLFLLGVQWCYQRSILPSIARNFNLSRIIKQSINQA